MKHTASLILLLFALLATSCLKNEFMVKVSLEDSVNSSYPVAYYTAGKARGWFTESAINVQGGKGELKGVTRMPTVMYVYNASGQTPVIGIYCERGDDIEISGGADPLDWDVKGNDINEAWSKWRKDNIDALRSRDARRINAAVDAYVRENTDRPLSLILLMTSYDRRADEAGFHKLYFSLGDKALKPEWTGLFERADVLMTDPNPNAKVPAVLKSLAGPDSVASIRLADSQKTLFWIRRNDDSENPSYRSPLDSLRSMMRGSDPKLRRLAVISFDPDTAILSRYYRTDSLPAHPTLWEPSAEVSATAKALGVPRSPYYVVVSASGSILFRGDDLSKALKAMR